ncbi:conserved hypothetical protein [Trichinella spiralis]|uniref:hypothetical protein n=1 Tax=Trichinella spiralis TaxID=6334 RepID=UPI0001EFD38F|nr:conserved hypothetical protein [Trichinella spiralis]
MQQLLNLQLRHAVSLQLQLHIEFVSVTRVKHTQKRIIDDAKEQTASSFALILLVEQNVTGWPDAVQMCPMHTVQGQVEISACPTTVYIIENSTPGSMDFFCIQHACPKATRTRTLAAQFKFTPLSRFERGKTIRP